MGLSRKLAGGGGGGSDASCSFRRVGYTWSTQAYTMREILTRFRLPCVVQCSGEAEPVLWADFSFDMHQPLLLHAARTVRKLHARSLKVKDRVDGGSGPGELEEFGPPLAIPEDYDGWFYPVGRNDPSVLPLRHTRVEGAANSPSRRFLVTSTLPAFTPANHVPSSGEQHVPHEVTIGEVLTKVGVVKGEPVAGPASSSAWGQKSRQSLRCKDENEHEVIIPFTHLAMLYDVAENYGPLLSTTTTTTPTTPTDSNQNPQGVVHTSTLVAVGNKYLPRVFRHVLGEPPALAHSFTGLLRCYTVFTEETVMAAAMSKTDLSSMAQESSCLELATDSSARFRIALNGSELKKTNQYALALETCEELAPSYVRAIKTSFTVVSVMGDVVDQSLPGQGGIKRGFGRDLVADYSSADSSFDDDDTSAPQLNTENDGGLDHDNDDDRGSTTTEDTQDTESVMTDDAVNSMSFSDATDVMCSDGASDVVEVEANSEFDFTWGQLKRARSFTGSISTLTDHSSNLSSDIDSEDSMVAVDDNDTNASHDSTLTNDTNSSRSEDTVVMRNSAPSPVYANVQKKTLSVYSTGGDDDLMLNEQTGVSDIAESSTDFTQTWETQQDRTVRSVWNITPTADELHPSQDGGSGRLLSVTAENRNTSDDEGNGPICWGDGADSHTDLLLDSDEAILQLQQQHAAVVEQSDTEEHTADGEQRDTLTKMSHGNIPDQPSVMELAQLSARSSSESFIAMDHSQLSPNPFTGSFSAVNHKQLSTRSSMGSFNNMGHAQLSAKTSRGSFGDLDRIHFSPQASMGSLSAKAHTQLSPKSSSGSSSVVNHAQLSAKSSTGSFKGSHSTLPSHIPLSAKSSLHSEGSIQDLAIQRLEKALNEATLFLKSGGTPVSTSKPVPPPRRGKSMFVSSGNVASPEPKTNVSSSESLERVRHNHTDGSDNSLSNQRNSTSVSFTEPDHTATKNSFHETASVPQAFPADPAVQLSHHQSDSQINTAQAAEREMAHHRSDGQIDMEFVKTLGDRLMAVSGKSSLPRYQRLYHDTDVPAPDVSKTLNDHRQFRKKKQKAGMTSTYQNQGQRRDGSANDYEGTLPETTEVVFGEDWGDDDPSQREAILDDFDLLEEDIV